MGARDTWICFIQPMGVPQDVWFVVEPDGETRDPASRVPLWPRGDQRGRHDCWPLAHAWRRMLVGICLCWPQTSGEVTRLECCQKGNTAGPFHSHIELLPGLGCADS